MYRVFDYCPSWRAIGILLQIEKETTTTDLTCDGLINIMGTKTKKKELPTR